MYKASETWYASWFDTPFYHILYKDRDHEEAALFMDKLTQYLNLPKKAKILDLACGKGRHSIYLNQLGYDVTGTDLSENSIAEASKFANETLKFVVHNMCEPYPDKFDLVLNLFTSFGYFEKEEDNLRTMQAIKQDLNETGFGVIDFMNVAYVKNHLIPEDIKTIEGIDFHQKRSLHNGFIVKDISFDYQGESYAFSEKVRAFDLADFEKLFNEAQIDLIEIFGDYHLGKFDTQTSPRLILIFK